MSELLAIPWVLEGGIFLALVLVAGLLFMAFGNKSQDRIHRRVEKIRARKAKTAISKNSDSSTLRRKVDDNSMKGVGVLVRKLPNLSILRARLERAGLEISVEKYVMMCLGITSFVALLISGLFAKPILLGIFIGIIIGVGIPHWIVGMKANKRLKRFLELFPDAIDLIVRGLRSGLPVTESINMVAKELDEPVRGIFRSIGESIRLGVTLEKALIELAKKLGNTEFNFFATSIILQRETGGNLSEILNNLGEVLRKRYMMKMKIKALSSEARASAWIVGALPFAVIGVLMVIQPDYLSPLFNDWRGNIAAFGAACSMAMGIGIMMKMTKFEI